MIYSLNDFRVEGGFLRIDIESHNYALRVSAISTITIRYYPKDNNWELTLRVDGHRYYFTFAENPSSLMGMLTQ